MNSRVIIFILLSGVSQALIAEGLFLQTLKNTKVTGEQLQKSAKTLDEYKEIKVQGELEVPPFHKRGQVDASLGNSFCITCHLTPPHTKNLRTRTFMNMHTQYVACETCHFRPEGVQLSYRWQNTQDERLVVAESALFRQAKKPQKKSKSLPIKTQEIEAVVRLDPLVKITPFYQGKAVGLRNDEAFAQETKKLWQQEGISAAKLKRRALIHAPLEEKGPECQDCHTEEDAMLNLLELGATAYQAEKIQNNIVTQFFSRYKDDDQRIRIQSLLQ